MVVVLVVVVACRCRNGKNEGEFLFLCTNDVIRKITPTATVWRKEEKSTEEDTGGGW